MHVIKLISANCENFKGFKEKNVQFGEKTTNIKGCNGLGKSSIAELLMWVLHGVGNDLTSNPKVRREVDGIPVNDVPVIGEIVMEVDGKEIIARKVQKRSTKKDGSFSDDNTYSINGVEKNLKDFIAYFEFGFDDLLMCMNTEAFLAKKPKEMREFLFKLPKNISDTAIIAKSPELSELASLVEKYTIEEISSMNKASIAKLNKEITGYPGRIDEVNRQIVEDVDTAELELQANALKKQISDIEKQAEDSLSQGNELEAKAKDILDLKFKRSDIERISNSGLIEQRQEIQKRIDEGEIQFRQAMNNTGMADLDKQRLERNISEKAEEKDKLLAEWKTLSRAEYPEYTPLPHLGEDIFICPTCGQDLPEEVKAQKQEEYEENRRKHREKYDNDNAKWAKDREGRMNEISIKGEALKAEIDKLEQKELPIVIQRIKDAAGRKITANSIKNKAQDELNALPKQADLSDNQEYEALCQEILKKEEALKAINTGSDYREGLRINKAELQAELNSTKTQIGRMSKNVELEERIDFLRKEQAQKEQSKADCEKILDLLDALDKKKNELLVDDINSYFGGRVTWDLYAYAKNGNYKSDYCVPKIDGYSIQDNTANHGRKIEAMLIIALSVQKIVGIQAPIILDDGESLDSWKLPECESQLIVLSRSNDKTLKTEVG